MCSCLLISVKLSSLIEEHKPYVLSSVIASRLSQRQMSLKYNHFQGHHNAISYQVKSMFVHTHARANKSHTCFTSMLDSHIVTS